MSSTTERRPAHFLASLARMLSLQNERLFMAMVLLAVAPLWIGPYLPMVDMPQHAAQIAALREILAGNQTFTELFEINWFTPYLLGYSLLYLAALWLPITAATQLLVSCAIVSVPLLTGSLLRTAGADERWKWLAIPASFSFAFYWGFLTFMVALPFALLFLINAIRHARAPDLRSGVLIAVFAIFLFFCHVIVVAFASLIALGFVLSSSSMRNLKALALKLLPFAAPLPLMIAWFSITYQSEPVVSNTPILYGPLLDRVVTLLVQPTGLGHFAPLLGVVVTGSVVLMPLLAGSTPSRRRERWLPLALGLLAFFTVPSFAMGTGFVYERLGVLLVPLWLLAWDPPVVASRRLEWLCILVVMVWVFANVSRFAAFARETESFRAVTGQIGPGRRVASMVFDNASPLFETPVYLHFPAWYQATQRGIVDFNFADFLPQPVRYRSDAGPRMAELVSWYPPDFQWELHGGARYDYFIVRANVEISMRIFKERRGAVQLVARSGSWWLYRNLERATAPVARASAATGG